MVKGWFAVAILGVSVAGLGLSIARAGSDSPISPPLEPMTDPWTWPQAGSQSLYAVSHAPRQSEPALGRCWQAVGTRATGRCRCLALTKRASSIGFRRAASTEACSQLPAPTPPLAPPQQEPGPTLTAPGPAGQFGQAGSADSAVPWRPGRRQVIEVQIEALLIPKPTSHDQPAPEASGEP